VLAIKCSDRAFRGVIKWTRKEIQTDMAYQFPPDLEEQVKQRLASGEYASGDDVLRVALNALRRQEEEVAAIQQGIDDLEAGRVKPLSPHFPDSFPRFGMRFALYP